MPLSDLTGQVLTRKGQALPEFEAQLTLTTLSQLDLAMPDETPLAGGGRILRFALTVDSPTQAFGAFDRSLATGQGVEKVAHLRNTRTRKVSSRPTTTRMGG
ncbi:hypothetical protein TMEC54S_03306 [Thauera mechernichensis]